MLLRAAPCRRSKGSPTYPIRRRFTPRPATPSSPSPWPSRAGDAIRRGCASERMLPPPLSACVRGTCGLPRIGDAGCARLSGVTGAFARTVHRDLDASAQGREGRRGSARDVLQARPRRGIGGGDSSGPYVPEAARCRPSHAGGRGSGRCWCRSGVRCLTEMPTTGEKSQVVWKVDRSSAIYSSAHNG